jgi:hypothetical protein
MDLVMKEGEINKDQPGPCPRAGVVDDDGDDDN